MSLRGALDCICTAIQGLEAFPGSHNQLQARAHFSGGAYQDYHAWCEVEASNLRPNLETFDASMAKFDDIGNLMAPVSLYHVQVALLVPVSLKSPGAGAAGAASMYRTFYSLMDPSPTVAVPATANRQAALVGTDPYTGAEYDLRAYKTSAVRELERLSVGQLYHDSTFAIPESVNPDAVGQRPVDHLEEVQVQGIYRLQDDDVKDAAFGVLRFQIEAAVKGGLDPIHEEYL